MDKKLEFTKVEYNCEKHYWVGGDCPECEYENRIAQLEAELAKRRKEAQEYEGMVGSLRERVKTLEDALRPWAKLCDELNEWEKGRIGFPLWEIRGSLRECLARAKEALEP